MNLSALSSRLLLPRTLRRGFTIIELLVAVSVLSLMLGLAARIFYDAQSAVGRGMQTSQIIAEQRAVSQPLAEDFRNMRVFESPFGGNTPGFLVIVQEAFDGVRFPPSDTTGTDPSSWLADRDGDGTPNEFDAVVGDGTFDDLMRSDQIAFFRDASSLNSLTPGADNRYDSEARAQTARVWYGHVWPSDLTVPAGGSNPGEGDYDLATQSVLGRQALLLVEDSAGTAYPDGDVAGDSGTPAGRFVEQNGTRLNEIPEFIEGEFDVLDLNTFRDPLTGLRYTTYDDGGSDPAGIVRPSLFRTPTFDVTPTTANQSYFGRLASTTNGLPNGDYRDAALEWTFTEPGGRLQATTSLQNDFSAGIFTADEIAKLHTAFSPHLADFAIEFAADFNDDLDSDGTPGTDGRPDGEPDRDDAGNIIWYTTLRENPDTDDDGIGENFPNEPVTYLVPNTIDAFNGTVGATRAINGVIRHGTSTTTGQNVLVWSHTGPLSENDPSTSAVDETLSGCGKYWPYLIRVRYRLMDGRGDFRSVNPVDGEPVVGRWFEQILIVPRPQGLF